MASQENKLGPYGIALVSGAAAGLCVDLSLFPLDTVKTRLQSPQGFIKAGGFRGVYAGIMSAGVGSTPAAALFFCTYEGVKSLSHQHLPSSQQHVAHAVGASLGEAAACLARVPTEVVKQRAQASRQSSRSVFMATLRAEGPMGFYRGFISTVLRDVPFSFIQFPLWELFKKTCAARQDGQIEAYQSALCGALSGAIAAGLTNPLDVAKTRIMLAETGTNLARGNMSYALAHVYRERGVRGLMAGMTPRMAWMAIGGFIFLGTYDGVKSLLGGDL